MSFHYLNWAVSDLKGVSPVARLLAIWMGNYARLIDASGPVPDDKPAWEIDIDKALDWIGCEESELLGVTNELIAKGVSPLNVVGRKIQFTFPEVVYEEDMRTYAPAETRISIYVIQRRRQRYEGRDFTIPKTQIGGPAVIQPDHRTQTHMVDGRRFKDDSPGRAAGARCAGGLCHRQ